MFTRFHAAFAFVLFLAAIFLAGSGGCKGKPEPVAEQPKRFRPVDEAAESGSAELSPASVSSGESQLVQAKGGKEIVNQFAAGKSSAAANESGKTGKEPADELMATLQQLDRLAQQQPRGNTQQEQLEDLLRTQGQRLALAKKAWAMKPAADVRQRVAMAMYEIHQFMVQLRAPDAMNQLVQFGKTMAADEDVEIARIGRHAAFTASLSRIASQPLENGKEIASEAKKLLESEAGQLSEATQELVGQTADMLTQSGFKEDAAGLIEALAGALKGDEKQAAQAARYALIARLVRADFDTLLDGVLKEEPGAGEKIVAAVKSLLTDVPPGRDLLNRTQTVAHILESTGHHQEAQDCYTAIAAAFENVTEPELADAKVMAEKAKQRIGLIGQPLAVEGVLPDGRPFDWSPYQGKVVLVDFWATWCGPCIEELPNIRQNFEQFHAKGFEVVGVNLDTNIAQLKQFLTLQDLPWTTVTSQEALDGKLPESEGFSAPMAAKCGVQGIPFVVLIGKDGNVDSIHVRGSKLKRRLTELLGEPITSAVPEDPTRAAPAAGKAGAER
jgi:thiol-disulfide isomerase/thioredoxin